MVAGPATVVSLTESSSALTNPKVGGNHHHHRRRQFLELLNVSIGNYESPISSAAPGSIEMGIGFAGVIHIASTIAILTAEMTLYAHVKR